MVTCPISGTTGRLVKGHSRTCPLVKFNFLCSTTIIWFCLLFTVSKYQQQQKIWKTIIKNFKVIFCDPQSWWPPFFFFFFFFFFKLLLLYWSLLVHFKIGPCFHRKYFLQIYLCEIQIRKLQNRYQYQSTLEDSH